MPKVSLMKSTVSVTYVSLLDSTSATWLATSEPMAPTNTTPEINTPNRINPVPVPRRQPRRCNQLTPGSMARVRNSDTSRSRRKPETMPNNSRAARATRNPNHNNTTARYTHFGIGWSLTALTLSMGSVRHSAPNAGTIEQWSTLPKSSTFG